MLEQRPSRAADTLERLTERAVASPAMERFETNTSLPTSFGRLAHQFFNVGFGPTETEGIGWWQGVKMEALSTRMAWRDARAARKNRRT